MSCCHKHIIMCRVLKSIGNAGILSIMIEVIWNYGTTTSFVAIGLYLSLKPVEIVSFCLVIS
jgi:hypothetical protein